MVELAPVQKRERITGWCAPFVIALAVLVAFWNVPHNVFELDDWHTITQNPAVRSTANIPRYFGDASTSSILKENQDYRPILQTTYAINHAMSGYNEDPTGFDAWHWTNIAIHFGVSWCIFLIGRRLIGSLGLAPIPGLGAPAADASCLFAAMLFSLHPIATGPVNYISARSSTLTALWVLLAILFYLRGLARPRRWWRFVVSGVFFTMGMFTKIEAISFLALAAMAELLLNPAVRVRPLLLRPAQRAMYIRLGPMALVAAIVLYIWYHQTALRTSGTRAGVGVTGKDYLVTQFRAWWYYIGQVFAPFNLIVDYPTFPLSRWENFFALDGSGFLAFKDPKAVLAFFGWCVVGGLAILCVKRAPAVTFLVVAFFACLAPHSSIVPLAEPVNEHRPYLPDTAIFLLLAIGLGLLVCRHAKRPRLVLGLTLAVLALPLVGVTRSRNMVWKDSLSLWQDAAAKAPDAARAQMNYGVALMRAGRTPEAESRFRETVRLAPNYHYGYSNLGIALASRGDAAGAKAAHDEAVRIAPDHDLPRLWRGRFFAGLRNIPAAAEDFVTGAKRNPADLRLLAGAAETLLRLDRTADAETYIKAGNQLDSSPGHAAFKGERADVNALMGPADPNSQATAGAEFRKKSQWLQAEWCYREAVRLDPNHTVSQVNIGIILAAQGQAEIAAQWYDVAVNLQPQSEMPLYWRGRFKASLKKWDEALSDFRLSKSLGGPPARDSAAIIETLIAAGRTQEAEAETAAIAPGVKDSVEAERANFRAQVLKQP